VAGWTGLEPAERGGKITFAAAITGAAKNRTDGYADWRMSTLKELYSLIKFIGKNGSSTTDPAGYEPFIETGSFDSTCGPGTSNTVGERIVDCQDWSSTEYVKV
jgi:hypothetical protein